ncbi:MAG: alpha/beta fold hydrolase [Halomonadaceae bacterium]|nr:MAG: alpha/beta fold hydrolase [Halomonadaceae bacterium]
MKKPTVIFSHGLESGPWGNKIQTLADTATRAGFAVDSIDYSDLRDPVARTRRLVELKPEGAPLILAGSSMGAYVAAEASHSLSVDGLFLLAPAFDIPGFPSVRLPLAPSQVTMVHGWQDDVVAVKPVISAAQQCRAELHLVDDGHRLQERLAQVNYWFAEFLRRW